MALFGAAGSVVSRALVELDIDARQFDRKLDEADTRLREHGNIVGKTLKASYLAGAAGVAVLTAGIVKSAEVAVEAQAVRAREQAQLKALGISYAAHREEIERGIVSMRKMSGFNDEQLTDSFTRLVAVTHNVRGAQHDLAIAVDVARARHISLEAATQLVTKASIGQTGALRRMGINVTAVKDAQNKLTAEHIKASPALRQQAKDLDTVATAHKALALLQQRYSGQAKAYGQTTAGEFDRMRAAGRALEEEVGRGILPVLSRLAEWLTRVITRLQESQQAHEIVRRAVERLHQVWDVLVSVLKVVWSVLATVAQFLDRHRSLLGVVTVAVVALTAALTAYNIVTKIVAAQQAILNAELTANPIGIVITALALLGLAFYEAYKHVRVFREIVNTTFHGVEAVISATVGFIKKHWALVLTILGGPFGALAVLVIKHFGTVKRIVTDTFHWLEQTALEIVKAIVEPFSHLPGSMGKWARDAKDAVNAQLEQIAAGAAKAGTDAGNAFGSNFMGAAGPALNTLTGGAAAGTVAGGTAAGAPGTTGSVRGGYSKGVASFAQASIVTTARSQLGIPYHLGGPAALGKSTDCSGLAVAVLRANGISVSGRTTWDLVKQGTAVTWATLQAGDLVFFSIPEDGGPPPQHVGIYVGGGMMIHDPHTGASVEQVNLNTSYWRAHYYAARRYVRTAQRAAAGGGAASGDAGGTAAAGASGAGVAAGSTSAFSAAAAAAPRSGAKKRAPAAADKLAGVPSVDAVRRTLEKDYGDLATLHRAGLDGVIKKIRPELNTIRGELGKPITNKELGLVRNQLANLGSTINAGLTRAKAIIQGRRTEFESAWANFADKAMTAFDRVTQQHVSKMQADTAKAIRQLSISVQGPNGAFQYAAGQLTPAQQALQTLQSARDEQQRQQAIADAQKQLTGATTDDERVQAQQQLDQALYDEKVASLQKQADAEQQAAETQLQTAQDAAQATADQNLQDYEDQRQIQRDALAQQLSDLEAHLEARKAAFSDANAALADLMAAGGADVGSAFVKALQDALAAAGVDLSTYLDAAGGAGAKTATAPKTTRSSGSKAVGLTDTTSSAHHVTVVQNFTDNRPAEPAALAAKHAANRVWAV